MFRWILNSSSLARVVVGMAFLCLLPPMGAGQESQVINVSFAFQTLAIENRFEHVPKSEIEKDIAVELAKSCEKQLPFWRFRAGVIDAPLLKIWLSQKDSTWFLNIAFLHPLGRNLKDRWTGILYAPGDLDLQVLPKDRAWIPKVTKAFQSLLQEQLRDDVLEALKQFAPLGSQMANVPAQATAVLPLDYNKYRALSLSNFRIMCQWDGRGVVVLHSTGTGAANDFTPDAPKFKGIWVVLYTWEFGGSSEAVSGHVSDLPKLRPLAFFLEQVNDFPQLPVATH